MLTDSGSTLFEAGSSCPTLAAVNAAVLPSSACAIVAQATVQFCSLQVVCEQRGSWRCILGVARLNYKACNKKVLEQVGFRLCGLWLWGSCRKRFCLHRPLT